MSDRLVSARVPAFDMTKGFLVIAMVVYHAFNYSTEYHLGFRYLAFLPPSFILITGLMLTRFYAPRFQPGEWVVDRRLIVRGLKLVALFSLLNAAIRLAFASPGRSGLLRGRGVDELVSVFLVGDGYGVAFDVLLPIAYVLLLGPVLLRLNHAHRLLLPVVALFVIGTVTLFDHRGLAFANLSLASVGLVGALAGRVAADDLPRPALLAVVFGLGYAALAAWGHRRGQSYLVQTAAALAAVGMLFFVSRALPFPRLVRDQLALLGQYSLVAYIVQIAILHLLAAVFGRPSPWSAGFAALFLVTLLLTQASALALAFLRPRARWLEGAYRAVFA